MNLLSTIDELSKLGAITEEQAQRSIDRLETLEKNKPTSKQVGRYGALGAAAGSGIGAMGNLLEHGATLKGSTRKAKLMNIAANAAKGGIGSGAIPLLRNELDRRAEVDTLKEYLEDKSAAVYKEEEPYNPEERKQLGTGAMVGGGALAGNALAYMSAINQGTESIPEDLTLLKKVRDASPVPVQDVHMGTPNAGFDEDMVPPSVGKMLKPGQPTTKPGGIVMDPSLKSPGILAHEIGHSKIHAHPVGKVFQNKLTLGLGNAAPLGGALAGFSTGYGSDDPRVQKAGLIAPAAMAAPQVGYEAAASLIALRDLKRHGATPEQLRRAAKTLLPAWGSYVTSGALGVGASMAGQAAGKHMRRTSEENA